MPENTDLPADEDQQYDPWVDQSPDDEAAEREAQLAAFAEQIEADVDLYRADDDDVKAAIVEAETLAAEANPVVQTYDKSAGADAEYPDYGNVIPQGGVTDLRTDQETEYPDPEVVQGSQLRLNAESTPEAAVPVGEGVPAPVVPAPFPSVVEGNQDYVPKDRQRPALTLAEQVERGIGTPAPWSPETAE